MLCIILKSFPSFRSTAACYPITSETTKIPPYHEFLEIICRDVKDHQVIYRDQLGNVVLRDEPEISVPAYGLSSDEDGPARQRMSVVILNLGSLSRWKFKRLMPMSEKFLKEQLNALEFTNFHPLNENNRANFFSLLSGFPVDQFMRYCIETDSGHFDECPLISEDMKARGYRSSYQEDKQTFYKFSWWNIELKNFRSQPFDYDLRVVVHREKFQMGQVNGNTSSSEEQCYGSRLRFQYLLNNLLLLLDVLKSKLHFHITRTESLFHRDEFTAFGDALLFNTLREIRNRRMLNNTALILYSDQGTEADIAIEKQLPLLYIAMPPKFPKNFPLAMKNLRRNRNKLITVVNLYNTLYNLMNLTVLTDEIIRSYTNVNETLAQSNSLFYPVLATSTCEAADIDMADCSTCLKSSAIKNNSPAIKSAAESIFTAINERLIKSPQCAQLNLTQINSAWEVIARRKIDQDPDEIDENQARKNRVISLERTLIFTLTTQPGNTRWRAILENGGDGKFVVKSIHPVHPRGGNSGRKQCKSVVEEEIREFCICNEN